MLDFTVFSRVLVPVHISYWEIISTSLGWTGTRHDEYFLLEEPCSIFLNFFGLLRFDKNKEKFRSKNIRVETKEEFEKECEKYRRLSKPSLPRTQ